VSASRTPKKKPRGLRVRVSRGFSLLYWLSNYRGEGRAICASYLHRAGLKPLKPGESRIVTVRIEDK
jgi:hypothetical protein